MTDLNPCLLGALIFLIIGLSNWRSAARLYPALRWRHERQS